MSMLRFPYTNLHELNLDWIIEQLNKEGAVLSVNDKHGIVVLTGEDIARASNNSQTIEQALTSQGSSIQTVRNQIGTTALPTTAQTITGAIAEHEQDINGINNKIGTTALPTVAQTLTGAIAENTTDIANQDDLIGSTALPTTAQTITGAIAEHEQDITGINNKIGTTALPTTAQTITGAIAEHEQDISSITTQMASEYPFKNQTGYSDSTTIENFLDTLPTNECWFTTITTNNSSGDLVTLSGQHLFYIVQFSTGNANQRFQIAVSVNTAVLYCRVKLWWGSWYGWKAV